MLLLDSSWGTRPGCSRVWGSPFTPVWFCCLAPARGSPDGSSREGASPPSPARSYPPPVPAGFFRARWPLHCHQQPMSAIILEGCKEGEKALPGGVCGVPKPYPPSPLCCRRGAAGFQQPGRKRKALAKVLRARSSGACFLQDQAFPPAGKSIRGRAASRLPPRRRLGAQVPLLSPHPVSWGRGGVRPRLPLSPSPRPFRGERFWGSFCRRGEERGAQASFRGCI